MAGRGGSDGTDEVVAYYRVSTQRQWRSSLGLEAQRMAVTRFAEALTVVAEYTEVETGKGTWPAPH